MTHIELSAADAKAFIKRVKSLPGFKKSSFSNDIYGELSFDKEIFGILNLPLPQYKSDLHFTISTSRVKSKNATVASSADAHNVNNLISYLGA